MRLRMMFAAFCAAACLASAASTAFAQTPELQPCTPVYSNGVKELNGCTLWPKLQVCSAMVIATTLVPKRVVPFLPGSPIKVVQRVKVVKIKQAVYRAIVGYKNGCVARPGLTISEKTLYPVLVKKAKTNPVYLGGPLRKYRRHHEQWLLGAPGYPCPPPSINGAHDINPCLQGPTP
jgi:hypothetical protein